MTNVALDFNSDDEDRHFLDMCKEVHDPYECEYEHCPTCRQHWMDEKDDLRTRKEEGC